MTTMRAFQRRARRLRDLAGIRVYGATYTRMAPMCASAQLVPRPIVTPGWATFSVASGFLLADRHSQNVACDLVASLRLNPLWAYVNLIASVGSDRKLPVIRSDAGSFLLC